MPNQTFVEESQSMAALGGRPRPRRFHFFWSKARFRQEFKTLPLGLAVVGVVLFMFLAPRIAAGTVAAIFFGLAAVYLFGKRRVGRGCRARGVIVGHQPSPDGTVFFPVIEFQDCNGNPRRAATSISESREKPPAGTRVNLVYDPEGRDGCMIETLWLRLGVEIILLLFGAVFAAVAIFGTN